MLLARCLGALALILAGVGLVPAPASAAYCSNSGVHVVVDFAALGGGVRTGCMPTTTRVTGDRAFPGAGFPLTYVTSEPGAVCKVSGAPDTSCADMPPGNAYWGLFESHGGGWAYSNTGVGGVRLNPGDSVAFVWQNGGDRDTPGAAPGPTNTTPKPSPTAPPSSSPRPQSGGSTTGSKSGSNAGPAGSSAGSAGRSAGTTRSTPTPATPSATARASKAAKAKAQAAKAKAAATASPTPSADDAAVDAAAETGMQSPQGESASDGLPGWVPAGVVVLLSAAAAADVAWRRRTP